MSESRNKILVIVDGYSSGSQLPTVMREHGWQCVHVSSQPNQRAYFLAAYRKDDYIDGFVYEGDLKQLARAVDKYKPSAVQPGTESGVILADALAAELGLPGNNPATSNARRDKYDMHNHLKAHGVRSMDHFLATDFNALLAWAQGGSWPVVVKPQASAGSDSVTFCKDPDELEAAFDRLYGATNQLGARNDAVLAQRLLKGQEYFINGISGDGCHVITEIWRTDKIRVPGAGLIFDRSVLFDPTHPSMKHIVDYAGQVFDALGIRYGATHTELMIDNDEPTLIECASRLSGGLTRPAANYAVGLSQLDLVGKLVAEGEQFVRALHDEKKPHQQPLWQVQFISDQAGVVDQAFYTEMLDTLRSKCWLQRAPKPGDSVTRTVDLFSSPGIVFMSHEDPAVLQADYETVREWERAHKLFTVRPE